MSGVAGIAPVQGIVSGMANEAYHAIREAIGSSGLRKLARSPLHFYGSTLDPQRPAQKTSDAMAAGTLAHCALLEPHSLSARYAVKPAGQDGRTREGKAWLESVNGREVITADQLSTALRQADSMRALPEIGSLLSRGEPEVSAFWQDSATGVRCKCRPDWVSPSGDKVVVLLDVKTTQDASMRGFARSIWNYRYDLQAAFYTEGYEQASGLMVLGFAFIAVESEWPHAAASYMLDDVGMARAHNEVHELLELYARCKSEGVWPGYTSTIAPISLPAWAR
jgi:hypothetical protein